MNKSINDLINQQVALMQKTADDEAKNLPVPIWDKISKIVNEAEGKEVKIKIKIGNIKGGFKKRKKR